MIPFQISSKRARLKFEPTEPIAELFSSSMMRFELRRVPVMMQFCELQSIHCILVSYDIFCGPFWASLIPFDNFWASKTSIFLTTIKIVILKTLVVWSGTLKKQIILHNKLINVLDSISITVCDFNFKKVFAFSLNFN